MPPLVALTTIPRNTETTLGVRLPHHTVHETFGRLVVAGGGTPVFVGHPADPRQIAGHFDAVILNGGTDIDARRYGAEPDPAADAPEVERDGFELGLLAAAIELGKPVLGVCRGMQLINVGRGGTLLQNLGHDLGVAHYAKGDFDRTVHPVEAVPGSVLAGIVGERLEVNSIHHQSIDRLGDGITVSARSPEGVIEAIEDPARRLLGVQWHPEFFELDDHPEQVALFRALVDWAREPVAAHSNPSV